MRASDLANYPVLSAERRMPRVSTLADPLNCLVGVLSNDPAQCLRNMKRRLKRARLWTKPKVALVDQPTNFALNHISDNLRMVFQRFLKDKSQRDPHSKPIVYRLLPYLKRRRQKTFRNCPKFHALFLSSGTARPSEAPVAQSDCMECPFSLPEVPTMSMSSFPTLNAEDYGRNFGDFLASPFSQTPLHFSIWLRSPETVFFANILNCTFPIFILGLNRSSIDCVSDISGPTEN
jgi:hypothetical protein